MQISIFLNTLLQPFTSTEYYKKAVHKPALTSLMLLAITVMALAIIQGMVFITRQLPRIQISVQQMVKNIANNYPQDLVFSWNGAQLTANTEPLSISWPDEDAFHIEALPKQFLFYTSSEQTPQDLGFSPNDYLTFVNSRHIYLMSSEKPEEWTSQSLSDFIGVENPATVDKATIMQLTQTVTEYIQTHHLQIKIIALGIFMLLFLGSKLWFLVIETVLAILLFKLYAIKLSAKQTCILAFSVMIPTSVVTTLAKLLYETIPFPIQTVTFWLLLIFLSFQFKQTETGK